MEEYFRVTYQLRVPSISSVEFEHDFETIAGFMARDGSYGTWTDLKNIENIDPKGGSRPTTVVQVA